MTITNEILMRTKPIIITWLAMFYCTAYAQVKSGQQEFRDGDALGGNRSLFLDHFDFYIKQPIRDNPSMLYKIYWKY